MKIIVNSNSTGFFKKFIPFYSGRHWFAIKKIQDFFYNLDSKLKQPILYENDKILFSHLI